MKTETKPKASHAKFWALLRQTDHYSEEYKELIKESWVKKYSNDTHTSLPTFCSEKPMAYKKMVRELELEVKSKKKPGTVDRRNQQRRKLLALIYTFCQGKGYPCSQEQAKAIACKTCRVTKLNDASEQKLIAAIKRFDSDVIDIMVDEFVKSCITNKQ